MTVAGLMLCLNLVHYYDFCVARTTQKTNRFLLPLLVGIGQENAESLVKAAETCCTEDIYHFDDTERFFLVSCLALW